MNMLRYLILVLCCLPFAGQLVYGQTGQVGNFVWEDLNANGIQDGGEPGIAGVSVDLSGTDENSNAVSLSATTDMDGTFVFADLQPGTYRLVFSSPGSNWRASKQGQGGDGSIDSSIDPATLTTPDFIQTAGESDLTLDAGFYKIAGIKAYAWNDLDKDGLQTAGEPSLESITISLSGVNGYGESVSSFALTDANGKCNFNNLVPGNYKLAFAFPDGCQTATLMNVGTNDTIDSDIDRLTRQTANIVLQSGNMSLNNAGGFFQGSELQTQGFHCSTISLDVTVLSSNTPPISYSWVGPSGTSGSNSSNTPAFSIFLPMNGGYAITTTDALGCSATTNATVTFPTPIMLSTTNVNVSCTQGNNGQIYLTVNGGMPPFTFQWSDNTTQQNCIGVPTGTYTVTVTDANSCTNTISATITEPPVIALSTTIANVFCNGGSNGFIDLITSGGVAPYTYAWSNGATTQDLTGLTASFYTVTVTDANNCTKTSSTVITQPAVIALSTTITNVHCNGGSTGSIDVTVSGGVPPYTYDWSNDGPESPDNDTQDLTGLFVGTFTVTVTDANNCTKTLSTTITQPPAITLTETHVNVLCNGGSTGSIDLTVSGGVAPHSYVWSNGVTTQDLTGLAAGTYTVTISDANNCTKTLSSTITQPSVIALSITITNVFCNGGSNGFIDLTMSGGVAPYTYAWSNGATTQDLTGLTAGFYTVTVTDANNCTKTSSTVITQPTAITLTTNLTNPACFGGNNGSIDITVLGGVPPYYYVWTNSATTQDLPEIAPGTYVVTVTDSNGCTKTASATLTPPTAIAIAETHTNVMCGGNSSGSIDLTLSGGVPGYTYDWSNDGPESPDNDTQDLTGLFAGTYTVTVTDVNGCSQEKTITITEPPVISLSTTQVNPTCLTGPTGSIDLTFAGGLPPFTFHWTNGETTPDIQGLPGGIYTVTATDAIGCTKTITARLENTDGPIIGAPQVTVPCAGSAEGLISINISGGVTPYSTAWSGPNGFASTEEDLSGLTPGAYIVTVTDNTGCINVESVNIPVWTSVGVSGQATQTTCHNSSDGSISITASGGQSPYSYHWSNNSTSQNLLNIAQGAYTVTVTDAHGCTRTNTFMVGAPPAADLQASTNYTDCNTAEVTLAYHANWQYLWSNGSTSNIGYFNVTSTYTVTVTEPSGCTTTASFPIYFDPNGLCSIIEGKLYDDVNLNCLSDGGDLPLEGWVVQAAGIKTYYGVTDAGGNYQIYVKPGDTYTLNAVLPTAVWMPCPPIPAVTITSTNDTVPAADLLVKHEMNCPALSVDITSSNLRRCFLNNYYNVKCCNNGTAKAENAYVILTLDAFLTPQSSSLPFTDMGNGEIRFDLGDIEIGQCKTFFLYFKVECTAVLGQTHCTMAHIYPDDSCLPPNPLWSGASLRITSQCQQDSVLFRIKNEGTGNMPGALNYIIIEDQVMLMSAPLQLNAGEELTTKVAANGSTWRVEIPQVPYHPGYSNPSATVEGCANGVPFSTGFVSQFSMDDADDFIDIDCKANTASSDPNDKQAFPLGYGSQHFIEPLTPIEYQIRFQNTGNDTAFTVQVIDTLSAWLDPATIRAGASSHPYIFDLDGTGVAHFLFDNIMLPDSNINEPASHGFVKFTITPRATAPLGTYIYNKGEIYFDYNDAVVTNTTYHRIGHNFIALGLWQPVVPEAAVEIAPNPFSRETVLTIKGKHYDQLQLQVYDFTGKEVLEMESTSNIFKIKSFNAPAGNYFFTIRQSGQIIGNGKLIAQ